MTVSLQNLCQFGHRRRFLDQLGEMVRVVEVFEVTSDSHNWSIRVRIAACTYHACYIFAIDLWEFEFHEDNINCFYQLVFISQGSKN